MGFLHSDEKLYFICSIRFKIHLIWLSIQHTCTCSLLYCTYNDYNNNIFLYTIINQVNNWKIQSIDRLDSIYIKLIREVMVRVMMMFECWNLKDLVKTELTMVVSSISMVCIHCKHVGQYIWASESIGTDQMTSANEKELEMLFVWSTEVCRLILSKQLML